MYQVVHKKPNELKPHPKNPNSHSEEQIERLCKVIEYQGFRSPIRVSTLSNYIIAGHGRLLAAKKLGLKEVPVIYQDYESDDQEYADLVADNALAEWSELDLSSINTDIADLGPDFDIDMLGLKNFEIDVNDKFDLDKELSDLKEPIESIAKYGEMYKLGEHTLLIGKTEQTQDADLIIHTWQKFTGQSYLRLENKEVTEPETAQVQKTTQIEAPNKLTLLQRLYAFFIKLIKGNK